MTNQPDTNLPWAVRQDIKKLIAIAQMPDSQGLWIEGADGRRTYYVPRTTDKSRALRTVAHLRGLYA